MLEIKICQIQTEKKKRRYESYYYKRKLFLNHLINHVEKFD